MFHSKQCTASLSNVSTVVELKITALLPDKFGILMDGAELVLDGLQFLQDGTLYGIIFNLARIDSLLILLAQGQHKWCCRIGIRVSFNAINLPWKKWLVSGNLINSGCGFKLACQS